MNYGINLKEIREKENISQEEMADILKLSRSTYGHYETQYQIIPLKHLISFCDYFNISIDYVLGLSENSIHNFNNYDNKIMAKRLKEFRKENKITQDKLASILNCSYGTIAGYESGRYLIATPFLYDICKRFGVSADYLLGRI